MENPAILDMDYSTFSEIQSILDNTSIMNSFLEVLPPDCTRENTLTSMELESKKYNMTPARYLLQFLGAKQYRVSDLISWFEAINLEKALMHIKNPESLRIEKHPDETVRLNEGERLLLKCYATSYPSPEYQWFRGDDELMMEIDPELCIKNVSLDDSGVYTCLVTKWNAAENKYEYMYSNQSHVEIIPSDLHAAAFISQAPQPSFPFELSGKYMPENASIHGSSTAFKQNAFIQPQPDFNCNDQMETDQKRGVITICKQPFVDGKVPQGMSICLICEVVCSLPVNYQWIKNRKPMAGEKSNQLILHNIYPDPNTGDTKWEYQCEVYNEYDREFSQIVILELDEVKDTTPFTAQEKFAFMVANDTYDHLENLLKPAPDIIDVAQMLSSMGFKIFAFRNLTLTEMRNAFTYFCRMLKPGSYALFFFSGHGFDVYGQTYLQTVDSSENHLQQESVCSEYILQCLQETKPAMIVLLIDACRKLPPNMNDDLQLHDALLPGKIFLAKMKNNTIYGYSTSFLSASHESDNEANSIFVKHLKKYLTRNICVQDILRMVQADFDKDPLVKNLQNPVIKSSLSQLRKLTDPLQDSSTCDPQSSILQWCDIKRDVVTCIFALSGVNAEIVIEFYHHMKVFCNGVDIIMYLHLEPNANQHILKDMEINMLFKSHILKVEPIHGIAVKNVNLQVGRKVFLFKKNVLNVQKVNNAKEEALVVLKYCSKNVTRTIDLSMELSKIHELQLSVNHLQLNNIDVRQNCPIVPNSFK